MRRAVKIFETSLGTEHPNTQIVQRNLELLLQKIASQSEPPSNPEGEQA
ncbi:MAG TPA: hypothetical protein VLR69_10275 [Thermoanaerobaculia bacterium]|jgi:hypothetical protein|nr:hypothetical protein [Thermoanaerobaculia bacterium]